VTISERTSVSEPSRKPEFNEVVRQLYACRAEIVQQHSELTVVDASHYFEASAAVNVVG